MTGIAGALLAGSSGTLYNLTFPTQDSIVLLAVVLMGGIYSLWGAVVAGLLYKYLPALLDSWGLPADLLTILFGVGVLQVLLTAPQGLAVQFPKDMAKLGRLIARPFTRGSKAKAEEAAR
jgi:branched-chain amino acid transport system permease protein